MNWLAHVLLSKPEADFRMGNLLADIVRGEARKSMSPGFHEGVRCHLAIDAFTDAHPVVLRSKGRFPKPHRRFAGILVDMFYDHLLAIHWESFADSTLRGFTQEFNAQICDQGLDLFPEEAAFVLTRIMEEDRLFSYRELSGIEFALRRLSERWALRFNRAVALEEAMHVLHEHHAEFEEDFLEFFPQVKAHVSSMLL